MYDVVNKKDKLKKKDQKTRCCAASEGKAKHLLHKLEVAQYLTDLTK